MDFIFGNGLSAIAVIIFLEVVLCADSIALTFATKNKIVKIVHVVLAVIWAVCAVLNFIHWM